MALFSISRLEVILFYIGLGIAGLKATILTPSHLRVVDGKSFTLTCINSEENNSSISSWKIDHTVQTVFILIASGTNGECTSHNQPIYISAYCRVNQFNITVSSVQNNMHGSIWTCGINNVDSNIVELFVEVPIKGVTIINVSKSTVIVDANSSLTLECKTSQPSRPKANITWGHNTVQLNSTKTNETVIYDLIEVISTLSFFPGKNMNGNNITCSGNNYLDNFKYDWVTLNVTYPPEGSPIIEDFNENRKFPVIENKDVFLNCTITDSNPPAKLDWSCNDAVDFVFVSAVNITSKRLQVRASRKKTPLCSCNSTYKENITKKTDVAIDVLYPATIINLIANSNNISEHNVNVIENETLHVTCAAEGNPTPDIAWSSRDKQNNKSPDLTLSNIQRLNTQTTYNCIATNLMNDSRVSVHTNDSKSFTVFVLYPPSIRDLHNITKIEGTSTSVVCETIPGNPSTIEIRWNNESQNKSELLFNKINRADSMWHICEVNNTMVPTFGGKKYGSDTRRFYLKVLYPPEEINISSTRAPNHNVTDTISMIVNTSIKLICSAKGEPMPSSYWWSGLNTSTGSEIYVHISTTKKDKVTCFAKNLMIEMPENKTDDGINNKTIFVDVLYPPKVNLTDINVPEGGDVNIGCIQTPGKTTHQSIYWMSRHTNVTNNNNLIIRNVTRQHAGNCTCMVNYTMIPTYGESKSDIITGVVYLDVLYKAEISNFFVNHYNQGITVTVNESESVRMICILDSNPSSTMQISVRNETISRGNLTKTLEYSISKSSCIDTGIYRCYGYNFLNPNEHSSWREIKLFVNCSPRRSSSVHAQQKVTVSLNDLATLKFNALAYPLPVFKWWHITNSIPIEANNGIAKIHNTSENEFQIEYIITSVSASDFGEYVLTINNSFGNHQESFSLFQKDTTSAEQNHPETEFAGPVAAGIIGSIIGIVAIAGAVVLIRSRLHCKRLNAPNNSTTLNFSQVDQYELKDADCSVTADSNAYEQLQNKGADQQYQQLTITALNENADVECTETIDGGIANVYEKLHKAGSDQQYQQLKTFAVTDNEGHRNVYENLRIKRNTD